MTAIREIPLSEILGHDRRFAFRDPLERWSGADLLRSSIARRGILTPLAVCRAGEGLVVVSGFRRLAVAGELSLAGVPARVLTGEPRELFLAAVEEHAGQAANLRERGRAIQIGCALGWSVQEVSQRLLPPLGLHPQVQLASRHAALMALPDVLMDLLVDKGFSLRRCLPFCNLSRSDAELVGRIARWLGLGGRQIEEVTTCLLEVSSRDGVPLSELVSSLELLDGGADGGRSQAPTPARAAALDRLERRRLPRTARLRDRLDRRCEALSNHGVQVRYDRNFASDDLELTLRVGGSADEALDRIRDGALARGLDELLTILLDPDDE